MKKSLNKLPIAEIDSTKNANAFLLGVLFNQFQKAEKAWSGPHELFARLGTSSMELIGQMNSEKLRSVMTEPTALHPFVEQMPQRVGACCLLLHNNYRGDARNIWQDAKDVTEIEKRLVEFSGIGKHKAKMAIFVLVQMRVITLDATAISSHIVRTCPRIASLMTGWRNE